jgi:hypothetical protein
MSRGHLKSLITETEFKAFDYLPLCYSRLMTSLKVLRLLIKANIVITIKLAVLTKTAFVIWLNNI